MEIRKLKESPQERGRKLDGIEMRAYTSETN